nr:unnamed protein product [Callosobruchus analis]
MKADPELMFECLIYINAYYYPVYAISEAVMTFAKYMSEKKDTPNLGQDAIVCFSRIFMDLFKLLLFNRFKETCRRTVTFFNVLMAAFIILTVLYTLMLQYPTLKLENVLASLSILMNSTEVLFGLWSLLPCYKKAEYF